MQGGQWVSLGVFGRSFGIWHAGFAKRSFVTFQGEGKQPMELRRVFFFCYWNSDSGRWRGAGAMARQPKAALAGVKEGQCARRERNWGENSLWYFYN